MRAGGFLGVAVLAWLSVGVLATWQRDYFSAGQTNCATAGTIILTTLAGPLNYFGVNPIVTDCHLPEALSPPSSASGGVHTAILLEGKV
ncbi:hypothetical protein [[Mycobacterium] crassicus]|uniref:Uncharacterized protein n=1 Tax=[Mycobacterium] crassicus TaxID=2872309 RepID=A0ABU5XCK6_9MYCO|nr:hypothetical protein [Mycolicibacter sp. MYC098]MEB3019921.1 hypothetical protein [Mycolicibacter sp. MYC098]